MTPTASSGGENGIRPSRRDEPKNNREVRNTIGRSTGAGGHSTGVSYVTPSMSRMCFNKLKVGDQFHCLVEVIISRQYRFNRPKSKHSTE